MRMHEVMLTNTEELEINMTGCALEVGAWTLEHFCQIERDGEYAVAGGLFQPACLKGHLFLLFGRGC